MWLLLLVARVAFAQQPELPKFGETTEVTASRNKESVQDAPVSITVVDQKQIETTAADNYGDLLRGVPGLNVVQTSARDVGIRTRGASGVAEHRQLTLLDGRSIYLDFYGVVLWDFIPVNVDEVKQIEILRGPGSLWGANALSGVINVRTKSPRELSGGSVSLGIGQIGTRQASVLWAQSFDRFSYKASSSFFEQDAWQRDDPVPAVHFENRGTRQPKVDLRLDWGEKWSYKAGYAGTTGIFHSRLGPFLIEPGTYVGYAEVDRNTNTVETKFYWNRLRGDAPNLINGINFKFAMDTYAGELTDRRTFGTKQLVVYGGAVRANRFDMSIAPGGKRRNEAGVFVEDTVLLSNNINLNLGARVDHFDSFGTAFSPRMSLIFKPRMNQTVHVAYNRAFRAPSIVDNFLETSIATTRAVGNPNLRAEVMDAFEVGYNVTTSRFGFFTAAAYRNVEKNNIVFVPTAPTTLSFLNVGKVVDEGLELSWDDDWTRAFATRTSFTYQRAPQVTNNSAIPLQVNRPPRYQASVLATIRQPRWSGSGSVSYTDRAFWADVLGPAFWGTTRSYIMVDAAVGVNIGRNARVSIKGTNLLDRKIKQHIFGDIIRRKMTAELRYRF
jgi:outer membrane receptor protein involved in Fe transport